MIIVLMIWHIIIKKIAFKNCCQIIKLNDKINILVFVKKNKLKI